MNIKHILTIMFLSSTAGSFAQGSLGSGIDKSNMDLAVKPGNDFFEYSGGGWMKAHPLTAEYSRYAQFDALKERTDKQLRELIEELASKPQVKGTLGQKIGSLYNLALDSARRNKLGCEPIKGDLTMIDKLSDKTAYWKLAAQFYRKGISTFFSTYFDADLKNSRMNMLQISQGGLSMGDRDYYIATDDATVKIREAYKQYINSLFTLSGYDKATADKAVNSVMAIETSIARASRSQVELRDVERNYNKLASSALTSEYAGIDWKVFFTSMGIPSADSLSVGQPEVIKEVSKLVSETSLDELKDYMRFKVMNDAASSLSDSFRQAAFNFYEKTMSGAEADRPRWKRAVSAIDNSLGMAVGKLYVEKYFPESSKQRMLQLVRGLQKSLAKRIDAQQWMSEETKKQAHIKLNSFYVKIGYPDKWMNYDALDIDESLPYYDNMQRVSEFMFKHHIETRAGKPVDRDEWLMNPQTINAYYNPTTNEICFPAGILQPPFFNAEADDACNYGAIGVVIGHEMTHGFDDQGSQFDAQGNLRNWWTKEDAKRFAEKTKALADFFDTIEVLPGMKANGKLTLGENIADHGGINVAFQALKDALAEHPLKDKDGFTPEQRFFLSYGFIWANNIRDEKLRQLNKIDPHSPGKWRVNGTLPHINAWYEAFDIKESDKLFLPKDKRVDIW